MQSLASGTAGTGTFLTSSGRGSVVEIDNMLMSMWNNYRISPTVLYVNTQEQQNITAKCLTNASGPLLRYNVQADGESSRPYGITANGVVRWYYNPFSVDGGFDIPDQGPSRPAAGHHPRVLPSVCRSGTSPTKCPMSPK